MCGQSLHTLHIIINRGLFTTLIIGITLISFFSLRKHKGKKGLCKKLIGRNSLFLLIILTIWFIVSVLFWFTNCLA